jgi:hypothetical protein
MHKSREEPFLWSHIESKADPAKKTKNEHRYDEVEFKEKTKNEHRYDVLEFDGLPKTKNEHRYDEVEFIKN